MPDTKVLRTPNNWKRLAFYQKSEVLYHLTVVFCQRFLPQYGDRTVDQMIQAARSGKQNIIEGSEAGVTSTENELKLLNVARASISELTEDFTDYLTSHHLDSWNAQHPRYQSMQEFARTHNHLPDYEPFFEKWSDEELCNIALTLCHQVDTMINSYLKKLEQEFVTQGGIKERMHAARTQCRQQQDQKLEQLQQDYSRLLQAYNQLLQAYNQLKEEKDSK